MLDYAPLATARAGRASPYGRKSGFDFKAQRLASNETVVSGLVAFRPVEIETGGVRPTAVAARPFAFEAERASGYCAAG
jgi:hypothetical protein